MSITPCMINGVRHSARCASMNTPAFSVCRNPCDCGAAGAAPRIGVSVTESLRAKPHFFKFNGRWYLRPRPGTPRGLWWVRIPQENEPLRFILGNLWESLVRYELAAGRRVRYI